MRLLSFLAATRRAKHVAETAVVIARALGSTVVELLDQATAAVVELVHATVLQQRSRGFARRRAA
jgi:hypothetical protein